MSITLLRVIVKLRDCIYSFSIVIKHLHYDLSPCTVPCLQLAIAEIAVKAASVCMEGSTSKMPSQDSRCSPCDGCQKPAAVCNVNAVGVKALALL